MVRRPPLFKTYVPLQDVRLEEGRIALQLGYPVVGIGFANPLPLVTS